jgi:hypothetical protein
MSREIISEKDLVKARETAPAATSDSYVDRLFKYIPAELVAGYIFVTGVTNQLTQGVGIRILHWSLFVVFCILTPLYLWRIQKVKKVQQHIISIISFVVWVFALGGPFSFYGWYNPVYGQILLPVFILIVAIWEAE